MKAPPPVVAGRKLDRPLDFGRLRLWPDGRRTLGDRDRCTVPDFDVGQDHGGRGWLGKVGAGCDYQFAGPFGSWVVGVFADGHWSDIKGNHYLAACFGPVSFVGQ